MSYWRKKQAEHEETIQVLIAQPELTTPELAEQLGIARTTIERRLPSLEEAGYLLAEDDDGRLQYVGRCKK